MDTFSFTTDRNIMDKFTALLTSLNLTLDEAISRLMIQAVENDTVEFANEETLRAMWEVDNNIGVSKAFDSTSEMFEEILEDDAD